MLVLRVFARNTAVAADEPERTNSEKIEQFGARAFVNLHARGA
jgi:hypothetical protein